MLGAVGVIFLVFALAVVAWGAIYRRQSGRCRSTKRMDGKTVIVTGSSSGIGLATAEELARRGARVILACRNAEKANKVAQGIRERTGNTNVKVSVLDTSDLDSVREFVQEFKKTEKQLDVLINNAGLGIPKKRLNKHGFELTLATNHYGHFILTALLIDVLKESAPSRVVTVSSSVHKYSSKANFEDLNFDRTPYLAFPAYALSKLCNILFTKELARKLEGTGVVANCLHPGIVNTDILNKENTWSGALLTFFIGLIGKGRDDGAQTSIYLAVAEETQHVTGKYFVDCKESACSSLADDEGLAKKLWEMSERDVKLQEDEIFY
ncbi:retinol dehydrogenase 13-like [Penaeus japonicus]|uniref:retinol dehydrogenase 13-like n=1 Tax=Penaeus japonicus TaxID=27405 RepID=UPI001C715A10|nr:retinol dehydrogenase 13-like [Penaeus japonicus]